MVFMGFSATRYTGTGGRFWVEVLRLLQGVDLGPQGLVDAVDSSFHFLPALSGFLQSLGQYVQVIPFNMGRRE